MSNNFLPPEPIKDQSDKWRNVAFTFALLLGLGGMAGWSFFNSSDKVKVVHSFISEIIPIAGENFQAGGDLLIEPPVDQTPKLPELTGEWLAPDNFSAVSIIAKDQETGAVLYKKNEYEPRPIASLTKLMSALIILEKEIDFNSTAEVIGADNLDVHVYAGDIYTLQELWDAALVGSSNKAVMTLANALGWPEEAFVERMNQRAIELGMSDTKFVDPTGLGDGNVATASDVVILLEEALKQPKIIESLTKPELTLYSNERDKSHHLWSTNWLFLGWIDHPGLKVLGGKTGYTVAAGYNFTMKAQSEAGRVINVAVLGADSHEARFTEARDVALWVFENYQWPE